MLMGDTRNKKTAIYDLDKARLFAMRHLPSAIRYQPIES